MKISNAFGRTTKKGHKIYRITIDNNEVLSYLEQNKTLICIDICTRNGLVKTIKGNKNGKSWDALQYYTWAKEKENGNGESNGTTK